MTNKEKFLRQNVGFHLEDLSLVRQAELKAAKEKLRLSDDWVLLALSKDSLEGWEKWGFGIFKKMEFYDEVDSLLTVFKAMDDSKFKAENERVAAKKNGKRLRVSDRTFRTVYEGLQRQGGIGALSFSESNTTPHWEMNAAAIIPGKMGEAIELVNRIVNTPIEEITDDEKVQLCIAVVHCETMVYHENM